MVGERFKYDKNTPYKEVIRMPYQVSFNKAGGRGGRSRTSTAYRLKPDAQRYADQLNAQTRNRNARVVAAKKGTYDRMK